MKRNNSSVYWAALLLLTLVPNTSAFVVAYPNKSPHLLSSTTGLCNSNNNNNNDIQVVLLLPSNPEIETPSLQDSANQILSQLSCCSDKNHACAIIAYCNTKEADTVCQTSNALIALGIVSPYDVRFVATVFRLRRNAAAGRRRTGMSSCQFALGGKPFAPLLDHYDEANPSWQQNLPFTAVGKDKKLLYQMQVLFEKGEVEDYVKAIELYLREKREGML